MNDDDAAAAAPRAIYLASRSARRHELLRQIGVAFEEIRLREAPGRPPDVVEEPRHGEAAVEYVKRIARTKAAVGWRHFRERGLGERPVLAADTEVVLDGRILGKPVDAEHARALLASLSARTHDVLTAVAVQWRGEMQVVVSASRVAFRALAADEIARYVESREPLGKAGAYAIQGRAAVFVRHLEGSYSGVVGLPLFETAEMLARTGLRVP